MTLRPLNRSPKKRRYAVYDLEWVPADPNLAAKYGMVPMSLRVIGCYDGQRFRHFTRIPDFLNWVCQPKHNNMWFYAHAGGLYDLAFILEYLVDNPRDDVRIDCAFSGSAAIIVKLKKGGKTFYFCDSYWLLRQPLRKIGEWLGMQKGGSEDSIEQFYAPMSELLPYNEQDCRILYTAIQVFEDRLNKLGGELQKTIASTALDLFRRQFLKRTIPTDESVNEKARQAYFASRVEVYEHECRDALYYDINSSFPHAMTYECPGKLKGMKRRLKDHEMGLVKATVRVPDHMNIPPIPVRGDDDRVYFPVGEWDGWFSNIDLELLEETGGSIIRVDEAMSFEPFNDLKNYAETIYGWRKETDDPALKVVLKFLLNSLYGKFGEGRLKQKVFINPPPKFFDNKEREPGGTGREMLMPGVHALVEDKAVAHAHVPISSHITARARMSLTKYMLDAKTTYYCDTDGFAVPKSVILPTSEELGGLKLEKAIHEGHFLAPKLYAYREEPDGPWTVKGKGFSHVHDPEDPGRGLQYQDFCKLKEHKELHIEQFSRLKTLWTQGKTTPEEKIITKAFRGTSRSKRKDEGSSSVPWTIEELFPDR